MFDNLKGMADAMKLMGQAGKIKENMAQAQERAKNRTATGDAAAGMVKVVSNGIGEIISVQIDPEALKDTETLGPLIVSATNLAIAKGKEIMVEEMRTAMNGIDIPPGMI
jgi:DNA-binding YbaB/EbfC family protein